MDKNQKHEHAAELTTKLRRANVAIFADYKGVTAVQADLIRKTLRGLDGEVKVVKNNVARKIVESGEFGEDAKQVMDGVVGPTLIAFGYGDMAATAKAMHKFSVDIEAFSLKQSLMGRKALAIEEVEALATLPSREVLLGRLLATMNAPVSNFVRVLAAVPRSLLNVLKAVEEKKN